MTQDEPRLSGIDTVLSRTELQFGQDRSRRLVKLRRRSGRRGEGTVRPRRCARSRRRVAWKGRPRGSAARITHASHLHASHQSTRRIAFQTRWERAQSPRGTARGRTRIPWAGNGEGGGGRRAPDEAPPAGRGALEAQGGAQVLDQPLQQVRGEEAAAAGVQTRPRRLPPPKSSCCCPAAGHDRKGGVQTDTATLDGPSAAFNTPDFAESMTDRQVTSVRCL